MVIWSAALPRRFSFARGKKTKAPEHRRTPKKKSAAAAAHSIFLLAALASHAAMVTQLLPNEKANPGVIKLLEKYTNNDTNTLYNSARVNTFSNLLNQIWLMTNNQATYTTLSNMIAARVQFIITAPSAIYVDSGWSGHWQNDGTVNVLHNPSYEKWDQSLVNQRTMDTTLTVAKSLLTPTGDAANWGAPGSFRIVLTTNVVANAFIPLSSSGSPIDLSAAFAYALEEITAAGITGVTAEPNVQVAVETRTTLSPTNPVTLEATDASFTNWTPIATATPTNATALLTDTNPPTSFRLYRVRQ